jgi:hypothetical protein
VSRFSISKSGKKFAISPGTTAEGGARLNPVIAKAAREIETEYNRPADLDNFLKRTRQYDKGVRAGGTETTDDSGITRLNLVNKGVKDDKGRTVLSMQSPTLTALGPRNFGEFLADIGRGAGDTLGAVGEKVMSGGVTGQLLRSILDKVESGKQSINRVINPPGERVNENLEGILEGAGASNNPLFRNMSFDPIRVSDMDPSNMLADNTGVQAIYDRIEQLKNLGTSYGLDNLNVDPFNLNKGIGYNNSFMFNDTPIDYNIRATPSGDFNFGLGFQY